MLNGPGTQGFFQHGVLTRNMHHHIRRVSTPRQHFLSRPHLFLRFPLRSMSSHLLATSQALPSSPHTLHCNCICSSRNWCSTKSSRPNRYFRPIPSLARTIPVLLWLPPIGGYRNALVAGK